MGRTVTVVGGTVKDLDGFRALAEKAVALVDEQLPGTEAYEFYLDEDNARFTAHEVYASDEAILEHLETMIRSGLLDEVPELVDIDVAVALGGPEDPKARAAMEQLGFGFYDLHARAHDGVRGDAA